MDPLKMLVYGQSGVGKTVFCSTAIADPRTSPVIWIDFENRTGSIKSKTKLIKIDEMGKDIQPGIIDVVRCTTVQDLQSVYDTLFKFGLKNPYKSLVLDSLTEVNDMFLNKVRNQQFPNERTINLEALSKPREERMLYGPTQRMILTLLRGIRDLECLHIFTTALPQEAEDPIDGVEKVMPMMTGKLRQLITGMNDIVAYYTVENNVRVMKFQPKGRVIAKDAIENSNLGDSLKDPTMTIILDKILADK